MATKGAKGTDAAVAVDEKREGRLLAFKKDIDWKSWLPCGLCGRRRKRPWRLCEKCQIPTCSDCFRSHSWSSWKCTLCEQNIPTHERIRRNACERCHAPWKPPTLDFFPTTLSLRSTDDELSTHQWICTDCTAYVCDECSAYWNGRRYCFPCLLDSTLWEKRNLRSKSRCSDCGCLQSPDSTCALCWREVCYPAVQCSGCLSSLALCCRHVAATRCRNCQKFPFCYACALLCILCETIYCCTSCLPANTTTTQKGDAIAASTPTHCDECLGAVRMLLGEFMPMDLVSVLVTVIPLSR